MSLIPDSEKLSLSAEIDTVAKTFEKPIYISLESKKATISTNPDYNRFQSNNLNLLDQNPENIPVFYTGMARVWYERQQSVAYSLPYVGGNRDDTQVKLLNQEGRVRIKISASGGQLLVQAKQIELDGTLFVIDSAPRLHGLFTSDYWTIHLLRSK